MSERRNESSAATTKPRRFDFDRQLRGGWRFYRNRYNGFVIFTPWFSLVVRRGV